MTTQMSIVADKNDFTILFFPHEIINYNKMIESLNKQPLKNKTKKQNKTNHNKKALLTSPTFQRSLSFWLSIFIVFRERLYSLYPYQTNKLHAIGKSNSITNYNIKIKPVGWKPLHWPQLGTYPNL